MQSPSESGTGTKVPSFEPNASARDCLVTLGRESRPAPNKSQPEIKHACCICGKEAFDHQTSTVTGMEGWYCPAHA